MTNEPHDPAEPSETDADAASVPAGEPTVTDQPTVVDPGSTSSAAGDSTVDDPTSPATGGPTTTGDPMADEHPSDEPFGHLPPPPMRLAAVPERTGLVRDPYSRLGGIASGIAHRYGWDPTLVRLLFVVGLVASGGGALPLYLVAWVVVPRATIWPPTPVRDPAGRGLSNREVGIGIAIAGVLAFLVAGAGAAGAILVPLALVGGGVWLLTQSPSEPALAEVSSGAPATFGSAGPPPAPPTFASPAPIGQPVPPRSRRRKWAVRAVVAGVVLTLMAAIVVPVVAAAVWIGAGDGVSVSIGNGNVRLANYGPDSIDGLPASIRSDNGLARVDLRDIPASDFSERTEPARLDIALGDGQVWLEIPEGLSYRLDATAADGTIRTDGAALDAGQVDRHAVQVRNADPDIIITIDVGKGDINLDEH